MIGKVTKDELAKDFQKTKRASIELVKSFYEVGLSPDSVTKSISLSENIVEIVRADDFLEVFKPYKDLPIDLNVHPFLVSVLSVMMARKLEWNTDRTLMALALGGLLHNIGMSKMPDVVRSNDPNHLGPEDFDIYKTHSESGMKMASEFGEIPAAVLQIIFQHHELNGTGFPNGLSNVKIFPPAKVVCLADRFITFHLKKNTRLVDSLKLFLADKNELVIHDQNNIRALIKSFIKDDKLPR
jgi:HD-GYP domain-containing protein (c-di-GMP phosphodiesterase class II)